MQESAEAASPPKENTTARTLVNVGSYAVSGFSGYYTADINIRKSMYKNFATKGLFDDLQKARKAEYEVLFKTLEQNDNHHVADQVVEIEERYRIAVRNRFRTMGLSDMQDYWKVLNRNQKIDTATTALTVAGVAIGALISVTHNQEIAELLGIRGKGNTKTAPAAPPAGL